MFENFPYTNFHDLNMDWIIKIVKDFQGQYQTLETDIASTKEYVDGKVEEIQELVEQIPLFLANTLIPDNYPGDDSEKLQACLDELATTGGMILINRPYTLTRNLIVRQDTNDNHAIFINGLAKYPMLHMGAFSFEGTMPGRTGGLWFTNIVFDGTQICFDCSSLIRMHYLNCYFSGFQYCFISGAIETGNRLLQTQYLNECHFRNISEAVFHNIHNGIFDVQINQCTVEASKDFFRCEGEDFIALLNVKNSCIEGLSGAVFIASPNQAIDEVAFDGCYMEMNANYFDLSNALFAANMNILNCFFADSAQKPLVKLPSAIDPAYGYVTVKNNTLADRTAQTYMFEIHSNAADGAYKGLVQENNRLNYITRSNQYNLRIPPMKGVRYEFNTSSMSEFYAAAIKYFLDNMQYSGESHTIFKVGTGTYMITVFKLNDTQALAMIGSRAELLWVFYNNGAVETKTITMT